MEAVFSIPPTRNQEGDHVQFSERILDAVVAVIKVHERFGRAQCEFAQLGFFRNRANADGNAVCGPLLTFEIAYCDGH